MQSNLSTTLENLLMVSMDNSIGKICQEKHKCQVDIVFILHKKTLTEGGGRS